MAAAPQSRSGGRVGDVARRLYREVVRGRTRVQIVTERPTSVASDGGNFVLSPYRSGTTLLRYCLDAHPRLTAPPETDYLAHLGALARDEHALRGVVDLGFDEAVFRDDLEHFARRWLDLHAASRNADHWVDKSPHYAHDPDAIHALFPTARFLVMHRHPLDQIASFTRGGSFVHRDLAPFVADPDDASAVLAGAATYWRDLTTGLVSFTEQHADQVHAFTYEGLCDAPGAVLTDICAHLDVDYDATMLDYHEVDHVVGREAGRVSGTRGFERSTGRWRRWGPGDVDHVWDTVATTATPLGYGRPPA